MGRNNKEVEMNFYECRFIEKEMWFDTYTEFCKCRRGIKRLYRGLRKDGKLMFKWYLYANIHMNETYKGYIWDYLNDYIDETELLYRLRFYKAK